MKNTTDFEKKILGTFADLTPLRVTYIESIMTQENFIVVKLAGDTFSALNVFFDIEDKIQAAKYYTLIGFFNSEAHKQKNHYLDIYGELHGDYTADKLMFVYQYA